MSDFPGNRIPIPRRASLWALWSGVLLLAGCGGQGDEDLVSGRPVKMHLVTAGENSRVRTFPGTVEASRRVELAFQVPGVLVELPIKEGDSVKKGDLIGQLRPDEFKARLKSLEGQLEQARAALRALRVGERPEEQLRLETQVRAAGARLANARTEFNRFSQLLRRNAASRSDFELAETNYKVAQEDYRAAAKLLEIGTVAREEDIDAKQAAVRGLEGRVAEANLQLADTTLRAPFDGVIAQRFVENGQNVQAKMPIVRFQDAEEIEISVDVPEVVMVNDIRAADLLRLVAEFSAAPGLQYPVYIKEIGKVADPNTQTFNVRVGMQAPADRKLLPGMTATVTATYRRASILGSRISIPVSALLQQKPGSQVVWVVDENDQVSPRPVQIGAAIGGDVEIVDGLKPGERIITAGVTHLREGIKVRDLGDALSSTTRGGQQ